MKAEYKNDTNKGPGYGLIIFTESLFPSEPWMVALQRSSDGKFLVEGGNGQWVGESAFFPLQGTVNEDGSSLELFLDPPVIDSLDQQEQYRISLKGSDGEPQRARLKMNPIAFSRADRLDNTAQMRRKEKKLAPPETDKEIRTEANTKKTGEVPPQSAPAQDVGTAAPENLEMARPPEPAAKGSKMQLWILLALLVAGTLLGFFLLKSNPEKNADLPEQSAPKQDQKKAESAEDQVRKFFSQNSPTAQGALALAKSLPKTNLADQDAVYRLYYYAVGNNDPNAFLPYGDCLNPALPKWGSISKNAPDAMEAYEKAKQSNPEAAQKAIDDMLAWLEKQAAEGNAEAQEWLGKIKK